jgi:hypothetical protein
MKQAVQIGVSSGTPTYANEQFYVKYFDPYGGVWHSQAVDATVDDVILASRVQKALRELPADVLEGVKVTATTETPKLCTRFKDGVQHLSAHSPFHDERGLHTKYTPNECKVATTNQLAPTTTYMDFTVEFAHRAGQTGVQYLLEIDGAPRGAGSMPVSAGLTTAGATISVAEINYNDNLGNLSELADCSDRGLDDGSGQCECFDGFRGLACQHQEALV